jgi:magnesium transporter
MGPDPTDGRAPQLGQADVHTVVSREERLPEAVSDVLEPEGPAEIDARPGGGAVIAWLFREGSEPQQAALEDLSSITADDEQFVWVDLDGYEATDLEAVGRLLDLPEAGVRITLAGWQRPRLGVFGERFFAAVTVPHADPDTRRVLAGELDLFVGGNYLVSAHKRPLPFAERAWSRAAQNPDLLALDSAFLLSILVDELLAHYEDLTEGMQDEVEAMEERALTDASDAVLEDLLELKRFVFAVHRLAGQHRPLLEAFLRPDFPLVGGESIEPYFRDLEARLGRLLDALDAAKDGVNGAFDLYVSQVAHRTNGIMKVLTIVSATLLPATVVLGFFGTNFEEPRLNTFAGFVAMMALIVLITVGALALFARWGWLGRADVAPAATSRRRRGSEA